MDNRLNIRIDNDTKKKIMLVVKTKGKTLSEVVRSALEEYAQKNSK